MRRLAILGACAVAFVLQASWAVYTQTAKPPGPLRTERVKGDLYIVSGEGGNVALYTTSEGVVLVDDMFDRNHADILAQIKSVTSQPLRYVINTHQHDDHAGGDMKMLPIAEVIAHKNVRANLADLKRPYYEDTRGRPSAFRALRSRRNLPSTSVVRKCRHITLVAGTRAATPSSISPSCG